MAHISRIAPRRVLGPELHIPTKWLADRRIIELSPVALKLYLLSYLWSVLGGTAGRLAAPDLLYISGVDPTAAPEIVESGLWEETEAETWLIVDFAETQDLAAAVKLEEHRRAERLRAQRYRDRNKSKRRSRTPDGDAVLIDETALYRWYDADGILLYVGITGDVTARQSSHAKWSSWSPFAASSKIERLPDRATALATETDAIAAERPLFNLAGNVSLEARRALVDYLVAKDRTDLIASAMGRG